MTELLDQAIAEMKKLSREQQDAIASRILAELKNDTDKGLLNKLSSTEAVVWSPQTDNAGVKALSDLLAAARKENNA